MKVAVFSTKPYDRYFLEKANQDYGHDLRFFEVHLSHLTAPLARDVEAVCVFVNDRADEAALKILTDNGVRLLALRCAGFNNVNLKAAKRLGITVVRVPAYSPYAVAEHTLALLLTLNRKTHRAYNRVREGNFALDGLMGLDIHGQTAGIIGTGQIGAVTARLFHGFGCEVLAHDPVVNREVEAFARYVPLEDIFAAADVISLHCPLTPQTHHLIDAAALQKMKPGVVLLNTSRGALIDTQAIVNRLKSGKIGYLGLDVYEEEGDLFFEDLSGKVIQDDVFMRLTTFPNVLITAHQGFFTRNALENIAQTTLANVSEVESGWVCDNRVRMENVTR